MKKIVDVMLGIETGFRFDIFFRSILKWCSEIGGSYYSVNIKLNNKDKERILTDIRTVIYTETELCALIRESKLCSNKITIILNNNSVVNFNIIVKE